MEVRDCQHEKITNSYRMDSVNMWTICARTNKNSNVFSAVIPIAVIGTGVIYRVAQKVRHYQTIKKSY